jgi:hypothetical protein
MSVANIRTVIGGQWNELIYVRSPGVPMKTFQTTAGLDLWCFQ